MYISKLPVVSDAPVYSSANDPHAGGIGSMCLAIPVLVLMVVLAVWALDTVVGGFAASIPAEFMSP